MSDDGNANTGERQVSKSLPGLIRSRIDSARRDADRIETLRESHKARALDADRLDDMRTALLDYAAMLEGVAAMLAAKPDPRDCDEWRQSIEGKALERMRAHARR